MATEQEDRILKIDIEKEMKQSYIDYCSEGITRCQRRFQTSASSGAFRYE